MFGLITFFSISYPDQTFCKLYQPYKNADQPIFWSSTIDNFFGAENVINVRSGVYWLADFWRWLNCVGINVDGISGRKREREKKKKIQQFANHDGLSKMYRAGERERVLPDTPSHKFKATKSGNRQILCSSELPIDRIQGSKCIERSVGWRDTRPVWSSPRRG